MRLLSNGLKGWKQSWKGDLRASISVAFIAIPLGLGIGLASGVPPLSAVIPCVVGGFFISWFSGGNIAVHSTPKMLIGVTAAAVLTFGGDDLFFGYRVFLAAVVIAGLIQFVLGLMRLGIIGDLVPASVIKSLLSSVGVIIIIKQIPVLLGVEYGSASLVQTIRDIPSIVLETNPIIAVMGVVAVAVMFIHSKIQFPVIKAIPAAVWVIIIAEIYSYSLGFADGGSISLFGKTWDFNKGFLIDIPNEITGAIVTPDFSLWKTSGFWSIVAAVVVISSIEGILSAKAIDRLDPLKRKSNVNKELSAMGIGSSLSGLIGGLPVIPAIVATSVGVNHNGRSQLLDFFQAVMMLVLVIMLGVPLQHIPLTALAGILIHTGYKLLNPKEILNIYRIGWDQILIFLVTLIITLTKDLILGIGIGISLTLILHVIRLRSVIKLFTILFRPNIVSYQENDDQTYYVSVKGYSNFLNYPRLKSALDLIPHDALIIVDLSLTEFIDHSVMEHLTAYEETHIRKGGDFEILGLDTHLSSTNHQLSVRFKGNGSSSTKQPENLTSRQIKLQSISTELNWTFDSAIKRYASDFDKYHLFRYKTVDRIYNRLAGNSNDYRVVIQDIDYHEGEFQTKVMGQTTTSVIELDQEIPLFTLEKDHLFDKIAVLAGYDDIDFKDFDRFSNDYKLKGQDEKSVRAFFNKNLIGFLEKGVPYRIESAGNSIMIIGKERLMSESEIKELISYTLELSTLLK
ncbi:SulP family inorganic anion transporter [Flavobacteriales bacterium]|nr:SulP family inorganic anion transporter [Flavobacteriales bacterium]